jgi:hypothetical protein
MLEKFIDEKLFEMAMRESMNLNNPETFSKFNLKRQQVILQCQSMIEAMTKECGCSKTKPIHEKPAMETL